MFHVDGCGWDSKVKESKVVTMAAGVLASLRDLAKTDVPQAWKIPAALIIAAIEKPEDVDPDGTENETSQHMATLEARGLRTLFIASMLNRFREHLRVVLLSPLRFASWRDGSLQTAVSKIAASIQPVIRVMVRICDQTDDSRSISETLMTVLRLELDRPEYAEFHRECNSVYEAGLTALITLRELFEDEEENLDLLSNLKLDALLQNVDENSDSADALQILVRIQTIANDIRHLGLTDSLDSDEQFDQLVDNKIESHVKNTCEGEFDEKYLDSLESWLEDSLMPWLNIILPTDSAILTSLRATLLQKLRNILCKLRIDELFDMIVDFPDSLPAILDLKACLSNSGLRSYLIESLMTSFKKRLQHPGANTSDILTQYVLSIKALRALDPSGVILDIVCGPLREYLRDRSDTVRCVVTSLIDDSNTEIDLADTNTDNDEEDDDDDDETWCPDPVDADPNRSRSERKGDVTTLLVNIYGSEELFVKEYRSLLSDRLLELSDYNIDKETRYLELLKLRFGEDPMSQCEVMLKDIVDSKRITTRILEDAKKSIQESDAKAVAEDSENKESSTVQWLPEFDLKIFILSRLFWPTIRGEDKLELPPAIKSVLESYVEKYEVLKAARTLDFKPQLGFVDLSIELSNGTEREFKRLSPVHATIIMNFESQSEWGLDELSQKMQVKSTLLERKIGFWIHAGLIRKRGDIYVLDEEGIGNEGDGNAQQNAEAAAAIDDDESSEEEDEMVWPYVMGMLQGNPSLPIDRIETLLGMFLEEGFSEPTAVLKKMLDGKVAEGLLTFSNGEYALAKG